MKKQHRKGLIGAVTATALVLLLQVCVAITVQATEYVADTDMERALLTSGFKVQRAHSAEQRHQIRNMPDNEFTEVKQAGNTYYLYADKRANKLFAGDQYAYRAYRGYIHNRKLRQQGVFVWEVKPYDRANNKTIEVWHGWTPFPEWSNSRPNDY